MKEPIETGNKTDKGTLYIVATPIGNLEDMTYRAVRILSEVDLIAAEDTRNSLKLLNHFDIHTPMTSYHEHNKYDKAVELIGLLEQGRNIALISDAGMPGISDPGEVLVMEAVNRGIRVSPVPGACAAVSGLVVSGQSTRYFAFEGFLPAGKKERKERLAALSRETRTILLHEAPHHLRSTLGELYEALGDRSVSFCRELTKVHEEVIKTTLSQAVEYYGKAEPKGEFIIVIEGADPATAARGTQEENIKESLSVPELVEKYESKGMSRKEAMRLAARELGVSRRDVYNSLLEKL